MLRIKSEHAEKSEQLIVSRTQQDLKSLPYTFHQFKNQDIPNYSPISREWQISKCNLLQLPFEKKQPQADYYVGKPLGSFIPLEQYPIERDGNC